MRNWIQLLQWMIVGVLFLTVGSCSAGAQPGKKKPPLRRKSGVQKVTKAKPHLEVLRWRALQNDWKTTGKATYAQGGVFHQVAVKENALQLSSYRNKGPRKVRFLYIPNSNHNTIVKLDVESGEVVWTFQLDSLSKGKQKIGTSPSRTTVDRNGNMWVGLREGPGYVVGLSPQGRLLRSPVFIGKGPRAITVDKNGDIWASHHDRNSPKDVNVNIVKISGKPPFKVLARFQSKNVFAYGATTDSDGYVWILSRVSGRLVKIDPNADSKKKKNPVIGIVPLPDGYGIAADNKGNVWVACYNSSRLHRINARTLKSTPTPLPLGAKGRGVGVDHQGHVWVACSHASSGSGHIRRLVRVNPHAPPGKQMKIYPQVGLISIGIAVEGKRHVWVISEMEGLAYKVDRATGRISSFPTCDPTHRRSCLGKEPGKRYQCNKCAWEPKHAWCSFCNKGVLSDKCRKCNHNSRLPWCSYCIQKLYKNECKDCRQVKGYRTTNARPYTYSDMTGFQHQLRFLPTKGTWRFHVNTTCLNRWVRIRWREVLPEPTSQIQVEWRYARDAMALARARWQPFLPNRRGKRATISPSSWFEFKVTFTTSHPTLSPRLHDFRMAFPSGTGPHPSPTTCIPYGFKYTLLQKLEATCYRGSSWDCYQAGFWYHRKYKGNKRCKKARLFYQRACRMGLKRACKLFCR